MDKNIIISGPAGSGKSSLAKQITENYSSSMTMIADNLIKAIQEEYWHVMKTLKYVDILIVDECRINDIQFFLVHLGSRRPGFIVVYLTQGDISEGEYGDRYHVIRLNSPGSPRTPKSENNQKDKNL